MRGIVKLVFVFLRMKAKNIFFAFLCHTTKKRSQRKREIFLSKKNLLKNNLLLTVHLMQLHHLRQWDAAAVCERPCLPKGESKSIPFSMPLVMQVWALYAARISALVVQLYQAWFTLFYSFFDKTFSEESFCISLQAFLCTSKEMPKKLFNCRRGQLKKFFVKLRRGNVPPRSPCCPRYAYKRIWQKDNNTHLQVWGILLLNILPKCYILINGVLIRKKLDLRRRQYERKGS